MQASYLSHTFLSLEGILITRSEDKHTYVETLSKPHDLVKIKAVEEQTKSILENGVSF